MAKISASKQDYFATTTQTAENGANLASTTTSMLTAMSRKNAAFHADSDKEETINYNDMPTDV